MQIIKRPLWITGLGIVAGGFGALTIYSGGMVLFVDGAARTAAGNYVSFVLWFNFLAGFAYLIAAAGLLRMRPWAVQVSTMIAVLSWVVFAAFGFYVLNGGEFEVRTVAAMTLRCSFWTAIAVILYFFSRLKPQR
jgi:hypothetical protein